jgi:hypothetical protein
MKLGEPNELASQQRTVATGEPMAADLTSPAMFLGAKEGVAISTKTRQRVHGSDDFRLSEICSS